ncbi:polyphosphate kinase 2 [Rubritalea spongiae]|uniref:ADP/GDP-polyphosphate phosphotransferase n=1 Tax=Rubritalea spongiae TaxID=430797 RepID=A0ABW5E6Z9_9BACT
MSKSNNKKLSKSQYNETLKTLQTELVHLQHWVVTQGLRVVIIFEGRDAAGKGGVIKRITERVSPRVFRTVALPAPNDREKSQIYLQRYIAHLPAAGEVVLFDRSWYNRAGVEKVMGFCTAKEHSDFLRTVPDFERSLVDQGVILIKYWLNVSNEKQEKRFLKRIHDPSRRWKLSPMDLESRRSWYAYSRARDQMLAATDTHWAPWHLVNSNNKKKARLNCISHLLNSIPYQKIKQETIVLPEPDQEDAYDVDAAIKNRNWIPERF